MAGEFENFWHLLGSKSQLLSTKKVNNALYYRDVLRGKMSTFGGRASGVREGGLLSFITYFSIKFEDLGSLICQSDLA